MSPVGPHARFLTSILLEANVVKPEQVEAGLVRQRSTGLRIGETLVEMGAATEEDICWALARQLNLPFVDPRPEAIDCELVRSFPDGLLHRLDAVPLVNEGPSLSMALADPTDGDLVEELERAANRPLTLAVSTPSAIRRVLREILGPRRDLRSVLRVPAPNGRFDVQWDRSGADFLLFHLSEARRTGASQIHFLARRGSLEVHHRIGERLARVGSEPPGALYYLLARIEALGGPVIDDRLVHVERRVVCPAGAEALDLGISLLHQEEGLSVTLELRPVPMHPPALADLGWDPVDLGRLRGALDAPAGLGIVTGPPRAGGSTTLACLLAEVGITGRRCLAFGVAAARVPGEVNVPASAAESARVWGEAAVAQCADIVVLDGVLTGTAVTAALSAEAAGRLLLVRTDWTDTFALLEHLAARSQDRAALAERLRFVVQQRLLRVEGGTAPAVASGLQRDRRAVFEVLVAEESLRASLRAGEPAARLRACAQADGLRPLAARLEALVASAGVNASEAARLVA
jgi:MSHA biogenesis protein MshE